ncbi:MAG: DNA recombination protein RmuC [Fibrobacteres bacterium]|nr:DNA recombination protein RmuC [Fibrobacterota bacterium]
MLTTLIPITVAAVAGFIAAWIIQKYRLAAIEAGLKAENIGSTTLLAERERQLIEGKREAEEIQKRLAVEFENLANRIFDEKSAKFTEQNRSNLDQLLTPLNTRIKEFSETVNKNFLDENRERGILKSDLTRLHELNQKMAAEAANLTNALKGESKTIGDWGEHVLETILEASGLEKGVQYYSQKSYTNDSGEIQRPDIQVKMPENRNVIVDSKATLSYYQKYYSTESIDEKKIFLKKHADSVRQHMEMLSAKKYDHLEGLNSPDFVFMFIPVEPAYTLALQYDPELFNEALRKRVVITGPSSLMASLKIISTMWRYEYQNRNVTEIAKQAGLLFDKFVLFVDALEEVGVKMNSAKEAYDMAFKRMKTGSGSLITSAQKIVKLGAKSTKTLDPVLLTESEEEDGKS